MISLSPAALSRVKDALEKERENLPEGGLRLFLMGGCSGVRPGLALDQAREDDNVFDHDGLRLIVDQKSLPYLQDAEVDYREDENGGGFAIETKQPLPACGCGQPCGLNDPVE